MIPRGVRNNNPGNIRWGSPWQGLVDQAESTDKSFCQFTDPKWGIRAIAKIMLTYYDRYDLNTVNKIIHRWAPPSENDTSAYVDAVASHLGVYDNDVINVHLAPVMRKLVEGIIYHENGIQPYSKDVINSGLSLAGIDV